MSEVTAAPKGWQYDSKFLRPALVGIIVVTLVHVFLPLRNHFFSSDVNWTEEGHRYSWRMMLRSKQGTGYYTIRNLDTGQETFVQPLDSLNKKQYRKMVTHPDMILQYAHHLRDLPANGEKNIAIYGNFRVRLNGRKRQVFIDPEVDLARTKWQWLGAKKWVLAE